MLSLAVLALIFDYQDMEPVLDPKNSQLICDELQIALREPCLRMFTISNKEHCIYLNESRPLTRLERSPNPQYLTPQCCA